MADFTGKRGLVLGVANKRSIAWAIARRLADGGAQLAFTFQGERIEAGVRELAESVSSPLVTECDVRSDDDVARVFAEVGETFGGQLDYLVHSVAFAAAEDLEGRFTDTPRDRFWMAVDISAYSLVACARAAEPLMEAAGGGSIVTMTYLGGERAVPHYNVMGVAKATEWTSRSRPPPNASPVSAKTRATSSSERTSHAVTSGLSTDPASSRTFPSIRSPW